jgi:hypothetical protein
MVGRATLMLWIVALGTGMMGLVALSIVGAVIYEVVRYGNSPEVLNNWGGLIIGFFIGSFFNFVRAALGLDDNKDSKKEV